MRDSCTLTCLLFTVGVRLWLVCCLLLHAMTVILALSSSIPVLEIGDLPVRQRRLRAAGQRTL